MVEENAEVKKSSSMGIVGEVLRPFGYEAYKKSREAGGGRIESVILGVMEACMPATFGMAETITDPNADKDQLKQVVGVTSAVIADVATNWLTVIVPPAHPLLRYAYGQLATNIRRVGKELATRHYDK